MTDLPILSHCDPDAYEGGIQVPVLVDLVDCVYGGVLDVAVPPVLGGRL